MNSTYHDTTTEDKRTVLTLTTDHTASSYGIAVLVDEHGNAYGPNDMMPALPGDPLPWMQESCGIAVLNYLALDDESRARNRVKFDGTPLALYHFATRVF